MKISKVTISGFRAFNKQEEGTFDFTVDGSKPADFISVYAPNGFGKTSLYDAIEWSITDSIDRFNRNGADHSKSSVEERKKDKNRLLLRNDDADPKLEAFVEVQTDTKIYHRQVPATVYDFKKKGENLFFKNVILSQDAIDSFLREENPETRYSKFLDSFPDLKKLDIALNNIIKLQTANQDIIDIKEQEKVNLENKQLELNFDGDDRILKAINDEISKLIAKGEKLNTIEQNHSSDTELKILDTLLGSRIFDLEAKLDSLNKDIIALQDYFAGNETDSRLLGLTKYFQSLESLNEIRANLEKIDRQLKGAEDLQNIREQFGRNEKEQSELAGRYQYFQQYIIRMPGFNDSQERIANLRRATEDINIRIKEIQTEQKIKRKEEVNLSANIASAGQAISKVREELVLYPSRLAMLNSNSEAVQNIRKDLDNLNQTRGLLAKERSKLEDSIVAQDRLLNQCDSNIIQLIDEPALVALRQSIEEISQIEVSIEQFEKEISSLDLQLEKNETLNREIASLITMGLNVLSQSESTNCPLCRQQYDSYLALSERIKNNDSLDNGLADLLERKNQLQLDVNSLRQQCSENKEKVKERLLELKEILIVKLDKVRNEDKELDTRLSFLHENLDKLSNDLDRNIDPKMITDAQGYFTELSEEEKRLAKEIAKFEELRRVIRLDLEQVSGRLASESLEVEANLALIAELNNTQEYLQLRGFIDNNLLGIDPPSVELSNEINMLERQLKDLNEKQVELKNAIADLEVKFDKVDDKNLLQQDKKEQQDLFEELQRQINPYEQFVLQKYDVNLKAINYAEAQSVFETRTAALTLDKNAVNELLLIFQKIATMKAETFAYLETAKTADLIATYRVELAELEKVNLVLNQEKESLTNFISSEVKAFFHTELINQIYFKIEPHPDYTSIAFECSFSAANKPRLELWVVNRTGRLTIPTLYFSSAQINILSLSVFLARALTAKDAEGKAVNCIFIDDPIQSMDSINILSFVDLFRSLVISFGKQIIISTHEENFHKLLQKKVPSGLFNSKFVSLETFGKVAV